MPDKATEIEAAWTIHRSPAYVSTRSAQIKATLAEAQNWRCCYCGVRMEADHGSANSATFEHVQPLSRGGRDNRDNIVIACRTCNIRRAHHYRAEHVECLGVNADEQAAPPSRRSERMDPKLASGCFRFDKTMRACRWMQGVPCWCREAVDV